MAKKRQSHEQELPFVALMDTMTNVVGVLAIVLVMMGISLARAASRVLSALPPATEEQIRAAQAELDRMRAAQSPFQEKLKSLAKPELTPAQLANLDTELAQVERGMKDKGIQLVDLDALSRELSNREAELKQKKAAADQLMAERDRVKALLDTTPVSKAPPAKVVRLPASRPIPEGAKIEHIIVTKDGPHWIDVEGAKAVFLNEFKLPLLRQAVRGEVKRGKQSVVIYDHEEVTRYFEKRKLSFREFQIAVTYASWTSSPVLRLLPRSPASVAGVQAILQRFRMTPNTVVMFRVTSDGFENYLAAREFCDKINVPAGWEYAGGPEFTIHVPEIETNRPKPPAPAPPPVTPAAGTEIKPPAKKLD